MGVKVNLTGVRLPSFRSSSASALSRTMGNDGWVAYYMDKFGCSEGEAERMNREERRGYEEKGKGYEEEGQRYEDERKR